MPEVRIPVNTIAIPASLARAMTSSSALRPARLDHGGHAGLDRASSASGKGRTPPRPLRCRSFGDAPTRGLGRLARFRMRRCARNRAVDLARADPAVTRRARTRSRST
jgi:hypothetical protein